MKFPRMYPCRFFQNAFSGVSRLSQSRLIKTYYGSSSENPLFREVLDDFHAIYGFYPEMATQDKFSARNKRI
jgi:hypothetical protein